ncbi:hypothetical protein D1007_09001 [Hordeum vulgare]|nr:hypothetical protein D1007_09001 [Hordeum vulgare]
MNKLSHESRDVYSPLRVDFTADLDQRFKDHGKNILQTVDKLVQANTTMLVGLLTAHMYGVLEELGLELETLRTD